MSFTTLDLAKRFERPHYSLLRAAEKICEQCTVPFRNDNFLLSTYADIQGAKHPYYELTDRSTILISTSFKIYNKQHIREDILYEMNVMESFIMDTKTIAQHFKKHPKEVRSAIWILYARSTNEFRSNFTLEDELNPKVNQLGFLMLICTFLGRRYVPMKETFLNKMIKV